ncbi:MAG: SDR family oxidoreductase [Pseudomonadota bacterium]
MRTVEAVVVARAGGLSAHSTVSRLANKVILVTGATTGIGVAIARRAAQEGGSVVVTGRDRAGGIAVAEELGHDAEFIELDVDEERSWAKAISEVIDRFGALDALVNNAGVMSPNSIESVDLAQFEATMRTNAGGIVLGARAAIAVMKSAQRSCSIVNVLSTTAMKTSAWTLAYGASKAAALSVTRSIALHCAEQNYSIRCNAVLPGVVMTPMVESLLEGAEDREQALAGLTATHPIGRLLQPVEVASTVVYLASDESSAVTGAHIAVDGGMTAA